MKTIGQRIRHLREAVLDRTQTEFAQLLGDVVTRGAVGNWERDQGIKYENVRAVADATGAPLEWLAEGKGPAPRTPADLGRAIVPIGMEFQPEPRTRAVSTVTGYKGRLPDAIPDVETDAGAGPGTEAEPGVVARGGETYGGGMVRGEIVLPRYLLQEYSQALAPHIHAVRVKGDSMAETLLPGDRVFVDTTDRSIGQGGVFVLFDKRSRETLVKRLRRVGKGRALRIEIISDNPRQGPPEAVEPDDLDIVGRAVARLTRL